jgi:hypothetical protein
MYSCRWSINIFTPALFKISPIAIGPTCSTTKHQFKTAFYTSLSPQNLSGSYSCNGRIKRGRKRYFWRQSTKVFVRNLFWITFNEDKTRRFHSDVTRPQNDGLDRFLLIVIISIDVLRSYL